MIKDFTCMLYSGLLESLLHKGYTLLTFQNYIQASKNGKVVILRHDVDKLPANALEMARIENELNVQASYYFRTQKDNFEKEIVKEIVELGHEIGYHYENISYVANKKDFHKIEIRNSKHETKGSQKSGDRRQKTEGKDIKAVELLSRGDVKRECKKMLSTNEQINESTSLLYKFAIQDFKKNLAKLRELYPVKTICMHGNPMSKYDNRKLWEKYHYKDFGINAEPYFDVDFSEVLYLTDTGRRWDGEEYSVRDKVKKEARSQKTEDRRENPKISAHQINKSTFKRFNAPTLQRCNQSDGTLERENIQDRYRFRTTFEIIEAVEEGRLPDQMMINIHPQRWTDKPLPWLMELIFQNVKNVVKKYFYVKPSKN